MPNPALIRRLLKLSIWLIIAGALAFLTLIILGNALISYQNSQYTTAKKADTIIILGAHIEGNPLRPSLMLQHRLDKAIEYWQDHSDAIIITTGGRTAGYSQSEAEVMQQYLTRHGIPQSQILLEEDSTRTAHQFINAQALLKSKEKTAGNVIIITNDFHLPRSMMLAKRSGFESISGIASQTPNDSGSQTTAHIREPLAYLNSWLFDWPK